VEETMSRQDQMYGRVQRWRQSGESKGDYAERHGMSYQTLHYWDRKYAESAAQQREDFIPVTVIDDAESGVPVRLVITVGAEIRIEVR
jgi:transposase-like protein